MPAPQEASRPSVLFLSPALLERRDPSEPLRGVQLFDLALAGDLATLGHPLTLPIEPSWHARVDDRIGGTGVNIMRTLPLNKPLGTGLSALLKTLGKRFEHLLVGNPSKGLGPAVELAMRLGVAKHATLIAHKGPKQPTLRPFRRHNARALAISTLLRDWIQPWPSEVIVRYGVTNAHLFEPPANRAARLARAITPDDPLNLIMLGKLDEPWKGARVVIDAVMSLPDDVRTRVHLHAASFIDPPPLPDDAPITLHPWRPVSEVPALLAEMDAMVVPSLSQRETFSQAIVQGMLMGLPIISSDLPVLAEKLDAGGGIVVPRDEGPAGYVRAIEALLADPESRVRTGEAACRTALERYVWDSDWFSREFLSSG